MAALSPGASLPLSGSTVVWIFLLWHGLLGGMWSDIFDDYAGASWRWERVTRTSEKCLKAASTTKGDGLSGIVPQSISRMDLYRCAMGYSKPCFGYFSPEDVPMGNARRGQRCPEIFEGVDENLRKKEPHSGIGSDEFYVFKEVRATVWGSAEYLGPIVESVLPENDQLL